MAVASERSFPFDSDQVNGVYDREYFADDFARFFRAFISSGTFMNEASNLQVIANGDMSVTLKPGSMIIDGYRYDNVADIIINISPADGVLKRIDRVSATWSKEDRDIHYVVREGAYSYEPVAPECRRTAEYKDYVVADIIVEAGAISIKQSDIVDQRLNSEVCGLAMPFGEIDTSSLYDQIQAALEEFQNVNEKEFEEWFESIQDKLSEDQAGSLQNQIGLLEDLTTQAKNNLVAAINEVNSKEVEVVDPMTAEEPGTAADAKLTGDALKELNAKTEWKLLKKVIGKEEIALPDDYSEISVVLTIAESHTVMTGNITKSQIDAALAAQGGPSTNWIIGGAYVASNAYGGAYFLITQTTITLASAAWNGIAYNPKISVYYR